MFHQCCSTSTNKPYGRVRGENLSLFFVHQNDKGIKQRTESWFVLRLWSGLESKFSYPAVDLLVDVGQNWQNPE